MKYLSAPTIKLFMNIIDSLEWRYATKKFDSNKQLSETQIDTLKKAFSLTATSFGLQPLKMLVVSNKELQEKIVPLAFGQRQVADASHLLVICIENDTTTEDIHSYFNRVIETRGTDEEIINSFRQQLVDMFNKKTIDERQLNSKYQAYITLGNLMTVCAVEKIDACPMEGFLPHKVDELLNLSEINLKSVLLLPVGYRAEDDFMSAQKKIRKPIKELILEIK